MNSSDICRYCAYPVCKYHTESGHRVNCPKHEAWLPSTTTLTVELAAPNAITVIEPPSSIGERLHKLGCLCRGCTSRPAISERFPCVLITDPTGETKQCKTCNGAVAVKVFGCIVHSECTVERNVGLAVCITCTDRMATKG